MLGDLVLSQENEFNIAKKMKHFFHLLECTWYDKNSILQKNVCE